MIFFNLFLGIITFIASFLIAFFVFLKNRRNPKNLSFFITSISLASWPLFSAFANYAKAEEAILLWSKLAMIGPPIAIASILYFSLIFLRANKKISKFKLFLIYLPALAIELFVPTKYNIKSVKIESWGNSYDPGILFYFTFLLILIYLLCIIYNFFKRYKNGNPLARGQIKYFFFAVIIAVFIGLLTNFILPFAGNTNKYTELGPSLAIICFNSIIAYSIARYRLFDIRLIIQKSTSYIFSLAFLLAFYFSLIIIFESILRLHARVAPVFSAGIVMLFGIYTTPHIIEWFNKKTDSIFFKDKYNYTEIVNRLAESINKNIDLNNMLDESLEIISEALGVKKLIFLLYDKELKRFIPKKKIGFSPKLHLELERDDALVKFLNKDKGNVMWKELEIQLAEGELGKSKINLAKRAIKKFKEWDIYLCQPIIKKDQLIAMICLGNKESKDSFTKEDLNLINTFNKQIVMALENFLIYEEIKNKKNELEKSMNLMVGRELRMIEIKKEITSLKEKLKNNNIN